MRAHSPVVLFVILIVGLCPTIPAEDWVDTAFDQSETLPYKTSPSIYDVMPPIQAVRTAQGRQSATPFPIRVKHLNRVDANPPAEMRITLALLCTLLC